MIATAASEQTKSEEDSAGAGVFMAYSMLV